MSIYNLKKIGYCVFTIITVITSSGLNRVVLYALTNQDIKDIVRGTEWYKAELPCTANNTNTASSTTSLSSKDLTEDQKIAQTFLVGFRAGDVDTGIMKAVAEKYKIGGIFILENVNDDDNEKAFTKELIDGINAKVGIPLIVASDEEGGKVQRLRSVYKMPSALVMGGMTEAQVEDIGKTLGTKILSATGVNTVLSPTLDIDYPNANSVAVHELARTFGSDPANITSKAGAFAKGLSSTGVHPTYKHFPGLGSAPGDSDFEVSTSYSIDELMKKDVLPFRDLVNQHNAMVMLDGAIVPGLTTGVDVASTSPEAVKLLREDLKFNGIIMTDDLAATGVQYELPEAVTRALRAGVDMPIFVGEADAESKIKSAIDAVKAAKIDVQARVDKIISYKNGISTPPPVAATSPTTTVAPTSTSTPTTPSSASYTHIALGDIPVGGLKGVKATVFDTGGGDDNGIGFYYDDKFSNVKNAVVAELNNAKSMGGLNPAVGVNGPKKGGPFAKIEIQYKGKSVIAEVGDKGAGDGSGVVDLHAETVKLLGGDPNNWSNGLGAGEEVDIYAVPIDTPVTRWGESASTATPGTSDNSCSSDATTTSTTTSTPTTNSSNANESTIWNFFAAKGLTSVQIAGIMGNMSWETEGTLDPQQKQKNGGPGYGIIQWSEAGGGEQKLQRLLKEAKIEGDYKNINTQLEMVWWHMNNTTPLGLSGFYESFKTIKDVEEATIFFQDKMEGPAADSAHTEDRVSAAKDLLNRLGGGTTNPVTVNMPSKSGVVLGSFLTRRINTNYLVTKKGFSNV